MGRSQTNPKSLANLTPYKPGQSGNPAGRKTAGASIREWMNSLVNQPIEKVEAIANDKSLPVAKRAAACQVLMAQGDTDKAMKAREHIIEHTDGKAVARHEVTKVDDRTPEERMDALRRRLDAFPNPAEN